MKDRTNDQRSSRAKNAALWALQILEWLRDLTKNSNRSEAVLS
jgi:hypothetical protein